MSEDKTTDFTEILTELRIANKLADNIRMGVIALDHGQGNTVRLDKTSIDELAGAINAEDDADESMEKEPEDVHSALEKIHKTLTKALKVSITRVLIPLKHIDKNTGQLNELFQAFFDLQKAGDLQNEENRRDLLSALMGLKPKEKTGGVIPRESRVTADLSNPIKDILDRFDFSHLLGSGLVKSLAGILSKVLTGSAATAALAAGFATGFTPAYFGTLWDAFKKSTKLDKLIKYGDDILETKVGGFFRAIGTKFSELRKSNKIFGVIGNIFDDVMALGKGIKLSLADEVAGIFAKIANSGAFKFLNRFLTIGKNIGEAFGKIFGKVIQPLLTIFDYIWGFAEGWTDTQGDWLDKLSGGLTVGISRAIEGLITGLLDLVKNASSWVIDKLGFKEAAAYLDSFTFGDVFKQMLSDAQNFIASGLEWISSFFSDGWDTLRDITSNTGDFIKKILRSLLKSIRDENGTWYSPKNLISAAIPDAVYNYAGVNRDTGTIVKDVTDDVIEKTAKSIDVRRGGSINDVAKIKDDLTKAGYTNDDVDQIIDKAKERNLNLNVRSRQNLTGPEIVKRQSEIDNMRASAIAPVVIQGGTSIVAPPAPTSAAINNISINSGQVLDRTFNSISSQRFIA